MDAQRFARERLSVGTWPTDGEEWAVLDEETWNERWADELSIPRKPMVLGVDTSPGAVPWTCLAICGTNDDGMDDVQVTYSGTKYDHRPGRNWVVPRIVEMWKRKTFHSVVIDLGSPAASFIDELKKEGVKVVEMNKREYALSCGEFVNSVKPMRGNAPTLVHHGQLMLNQAAAGATKRELADLWAWNRKDSSVDISPLVASTLAVWGHRKVTMKKPVKAWAFYG
jgi:hypothetical protein